jgi:CRISPR system Cascade subunit CasC
MTVFIELHILTAYGPSNLNRDDAGAPKALTYGQAPRLRVSSQSLKRAWRTSSVFASVAAGSGTLADHKGERTKRAGYEVYKALIAAGADEAQAKEIAAKAVEQDKLGKLKTKDGKPGETEQLAFFSPEELARLKDWAARVAAGDTPDDKTRACLLEKPKAVDIAMFGRMLADNTAYNVEAAVQVAHAFTTHRAVAEDDYFTAVDDLKDAGEEDAGAGHIGVAKFGAGLFYTYICIDRDLLVSNLDGDADLSAAALEGLIRAAATVSPTGKQNSFASRAYASYLRAERSQRQPRSLAGAFLTPVTGRDVLAESVAALTKAADGFDAVYGAKADATEIAYAANGEGSLAAIVALAKHGLGA